jgi:hypothetical protein
MAETQEHRTKETLRNYLREVKPLGNESAKRQRFAALVAELAHARCGADHIGKTGGLMVARR